MAVIHGGINFRLRGRIIALRAEPPRRVLAVPVIVFLGTHIELLIELVILIPAALGVLPRIPFPVGDQIGVGDQFQVLQRPDRLRHAFLDVDLDRIIGPVELALRQPVLEMNLDLIAVGVIIHPEPVIHAPIPIFRVLGHGVQDQPRLPAAEVAAVVPCIVPRLIQLEAFLLPADALLAHLRAVDELIQQIVIGALLNHAARGQIQSVPPLHLQSAVQHVGDPDIAYG